MRVQHSRTLAIMEKLTVDMGAELAGWAGRSADDQKFQMERIDVFFHVHVVIYKIKQ